jgi:GTPase involved in cell partitioning and DNA repair
MFLRHLRRTRALMHVVDASAEDPATDYYAASVGAMGPTVADAPLFLVPQHLPLAVLLDLCS